MKSASDIFNSTYIYYYYYGILFFFTNLPSGRCNLAPNLVCKTLILGIALHLRNRERIVLISCHNYWSIFKAGDYWDTWCIMFISLFSFCLYLYICVVNYTCNTMYILFRYNMKYIIFEFHFSSFNSASGITAKEDTGISTFLLSFTLEKHSLYISLQLLKVLYHILIHITSERKKCHWSLHLIFSLLCHVQITGHMT